MTRKKRGEAINGWFLLDKEVGARSTWATSQVKYLFNARKAGHGGTLDPFAEGLLPIALGEATKTMSFILDDTKEYDFTVRFGIATDSFDNQGQITDTNENYPTEAAILKALSRFRGEITQVPPQFSAVKIDGRRAYDLARAGEEVQCSERSVYIYDLQLLDLPDDKSARFSMHCSKGTYVRSFAVDLAESLGTIGHLSRLRRTSVGPFSQKDAILLETLQEKAHKGDMLLPIEASLDGISVISVDNHETAALRNGRNVSLFGRGDWSLLDNYNDGDLLLARSAMGAVALVEYRRGEICPRRVFHT